MRLYDPLAPVLAAALALAPAPTGAGQSCTEDAMIVFDGSGSMAEIGSTGIGVPRISEARTALNRVIPEIAAARRLGLVIYGPAGDRTCRNIDLRFAPQWQAAPRLLADVQALRPAGGTSLTDAVKRAAEVLGAPGNSGAVVLVTDGKETCGGQPCQLASELAATAPGLTVHVIGFKVRDGWPDRGRAEASGDATVARCLADRTGGRYVGAETVDELVGALRVTLGCNVFGQASGRARRLARLTTGP